MPLRRPDPGTGTPDGMAVIAFDVNETLSDLTPIADRVAALGAPRELARTWFASVLRDGMALSLAGSPRPFADVADAALRSVFADAVPDVDAAVGAVLDGFAALPVHPDVVAGVHALADAGHRLVTLSNGSPAVAEALLGRAGVRDRFEALLSVEDATPPVWKPDPRAYHAAAHRLGLAPSGLTLVAVHPWDVHGAIRAGLRGAWLDRRGARYPAAFDAPSITVAALPELAGRL